MNNDAAVTINGDINYANGSLPGRNYASGWNLIGLNNLTSRTVQQEMENNLFNSFWKLNSTNEYEQMTDLNTQLEINKGYWIYIP